MSKENVSYRMNPNRFIPESKAGADRRDSLWHTSPERNDMVKIPTPHEAFNIAWIALASDTLHNQGKRQHPSQNSAHTHEEKSFPHQELSLSPIKTEVELLENEYFVATINTCIAAIETGVYYLILDNFLPEDTSIKIAGGLGALRIVAYAASKIS